MDVSFGRGHNLRLCYRSCLLLGFVLRKRFEGLRSRKGDVAGLSEIDVDKTMRLIDKLWEVRPGKSGDPRQLIDLCVRRDYNDKHGHRIAFPIPHYAPGEDPGRLKPVLDVIKIFDAETSPAARIFSSREQKTEWGTVRLLEPQVSLSRLLPLHRAKVVSSEEMTFLEDVGQMCGYLEPDQVIAIGRHEDADGTRQSLLWEMYRWKESTLDALDTLQSFGTYAEAPAPAASASRKLWQSWSFALECKKKAGLLCEDKYGSDRRFYVEGLDYLQSDEVTIERPVLDLLLSVQASGDEIWQDPLVSTLRFPAFCCWTFSSYCCGTLLKLDPFKGSEFARRTASVSAEDLQRAHWYLTKCVGVSREAQPAEFSLEWLERLENTPLVEIRLVPEEVIGDSTKTADFVANAQEIAQWVIETCVEPAIEGLDSQEA